MQALKAGKKVYTDLPAAGQPIYQLPKAGELVEIRPGPFYRRKRLQLHRYTEERIPDGVIVAGEFGAKMSAMDSATRNAGEVIDRLTLEYNRTRQAMITKELIEIISGAEAL